MIDLRKTLLAGTALVAVSGFAVGAQAQTVTYNTTSDNNVTADNTGTAGSGAAADAAGGNGGSSYDLTTAVSVDLNATGTMGAETDITGGVGEESNDGGNNGGNAGGTGGTGINVNTAAGTAAADATRADVTIAQYVNVLGGNGGNGVNITGDDVTGDAGGVGGVGISLGANFANLTATGGTIGGGTGGTGAQLTDGDGGSTGGAGGLGGVAVDAGSSTNVIINSAAAITGGAGGVGGVGEPAQDNNGGVGGNGAAGIVGTGTAADVDISANVTGGAGGNGGAGTNAASDSGNGGAGAAAILVDGTNWTLDITGSSTVIAGGNGGNGGAFGAGGTAGTGGVAGIGIDVSSTGATVNIGEGVTVRGGTGGETGTAGAAGGGVNAADGVGLNIASGSTTATITNAGTIVGGGSGGAVAFSINEDVAGVITNTSTGVIGSATAQTEDAILIAGNKTVAHINNAGLIAVSGTGHAINVDDGETLTLLTNTGNINGNAGTGITIEGELTTITNTNGVISAGDAAAIHIEANGDITAITGGTITSASDNTAIGTVLIAEELNQDVTITNATITNTLVGADHNVFTFTSDNQAQAINFVNSNVGATGQATRAFDLNDRDVILGFDANTTVTGSIVGDAGSDLTLTTAGTVAGDITLNDGTDSITISAGSITGAIDLGDSADALVTAGGAINGTIEFGNGADTWNVTGTFATNGAITNAGNTVALTVEDGGNLTLNNALTTGAIGSGVNAGGTLTLGADLNATGGAFTNAGTVNVGVGQTLTATSFAGTGTYVLSVQDENGTLAGGDFGLIADAAGAADVASSQLQINVTGVLEQVGTVDNLLANVTLSDVAGGTEAQLTDNSFIYDFFVDDDDGSNTDIRVTQRTLQSVATGPNTGLGAVLDTVLASDQAEITALNDALVSASSQEEINEILESVAPTVDTGAVTAGVQAVNTTSGITSTRLASLRDGTGSTGMVAGNVSQGLQVWGQVFGATAEQDRRDNVDGFDADTLGFAAGIDTETLADGWVWGLGFSYANTEVDSKNSASTETDVDSYQLTLYADYEVDDRTYISGQVAYAHTDNEVDRTNVGNSGLNASGEFDADIFSARLEAGRDYEVGSGTTLTPNAMVNYVHYDADDYSETGANGLNLRDVDMDSMSVLEFGVGVDASWVYRQADGGYLKPALSVGVRYDVIGDEVDTSANLQGGGATFTTPGADSQDLAVDLGASLTYFSTTNWELTADYNFEYKEDYDAHAGFLRAAYKF